MESPFKKMPFEDLLDLVLDHERSTLRARVLAKREISRREMLFRRAIEDALAEVENDERLGYPTATVQVNAPLALVQCQLEAQAKTLKEVLRVLSVKDGKQ